MFEAIAASWPLDLSTDEAKNIASINASTPLRALAVATRVGTDSLRLKSALLAKHAMTDNNTEKEDCEILCCWVALNQLNLREFNIGLTSLREKSPARLEIRILTLLGWLLTDDLNSVVKAPSDIWSGLDSSLLLQLCKAFFYLKMGELSKAQELLNRQSEYICPEMAMLQASLMSKRGDEQSAIELLLPQLHRCSVYIPYYRQLLNHMIEGKDAKNVMPCARRALSEFGEHPAILYHFTTLNLYKRQPGLARRSALLQQIAASIRPTSISLGNQLATYEMNGNADWFQFLNSVVVSEGFLAEPVLQANLVMQYASIQSNKYQSHVKGMVSAIESQPSFSGLRKDRSDLLSQKNRNKSSLNIAWITGDCNYHPVARFLYGWFASTSSEPKHHRHTLVSLEDHREESYSELFRSISGIGLQDVSKFSGVDRLNAVRKEGFDIAIDLSGWTGGNFIAGMTARLAPVQVNYLGYFASSGLNTMDYWLGDSNLFPNETREWASESLFRIDRPFLAWTPQSPLPEADVAVPEAYSGPVRFGSFNHNRKLTDATLRLWAELLNVVSDSRLVLKASAQSDSDTQRLLRRRMLRQGLDPERVDWLALTSGPVEHMQQYAQIDIALDPIPNGGCTTTCEALWMGVPTVTLAGSHYVSRMSTAVLVGANMPEWIAQDRAGYIRLACEHAAQLSNLRSTRANWRRHLAASQLGDASDLMRHLESAFSQMHAEVVSKF